MKRKAIPKRVRFEVLKRDKFTCQYCGAQAPEVVLNVDHITPVSKGGTNDISNLITSCFDCNSGKSDIELSDDTAIMKQKAQLDMLQERREQLEMMREWQLELTDETLTEASIVNDIIKKISGMSLTEVGKKSVNKLIKKFGFDTVCDSVRIAFNTYNSPETALAKVGGICWCKTHTTCYNCALFEGRAANGELECPACKNGVRLFSVKEAETCELFTEKSE